MIEGHWLVDVKRAPPAQEAAAPVKGEATRQLSIWALSSLDGATATHANRIYMLYVFYSLYVRACGVNGAAGARPEKNSRPWGNISWSVKSVSPLLLFHHRLSPPPP